MNELLQGIISILSPMLIGIEYFLSLFIRDDLVIFGLPFYQWVIGLIFVGIIINIVLNLGDDE